MNIKEWLIEQIAEETGLKFSEVSCDEDFEKFDLDSLSLVSLSYDLEAKLQKEISPTVFTEFDTINKLSAWLENQA